MEIENLRLISKSREFLDSQECRLFEGFKDADNQARTLVANLIEDLQAQCRLFKKGFKNTEKVVRTLVADLVDDICGQQRRAIRIKQRIQ